MPPYLRSDAATRGVTAHRRDTLRKFPTLHPLYTTVRERWPCRLLIETHGFSRVRCSEIDRQPVRTYFQ